MKRRNIMQANVMEWEIYARMALIVAFLYMLYSIGVPLAYIIPLGILSIAMVFLRGKIYENIEHEISKRFPKYHGLPGWAKRIVIIIIFLAAYFILKQIIFFALKMFGIDVQQDIDEIISAYAQK